MSPLVTLFLLTEGEQRPALFLGTSSDRIGSPEGEQSYYATASKYIPLLRTSVYAGVNYSEWDAAVNYPAGFAVDLGKGFSLRPMYDGQRTHLLLNFFTERYGLSLMYVWLERPGLSLFIGF